MPWSRRKQGGTENAHRRAASDPGLLFTWRRQLTVKASAGFLPVQLTADSAGTPVASSEPTPCLDGMIEIEMRNGVWVRVGHGADLKALRGVLTILDGR